jgi:hypothetical protein
MHCQQAFFIACPVWLEFGCAVEEVTMAPPGKLFHYTPRLMMTALLCAEFNYFIPVFISSSLNHHVCNQILYCRLSKNKGL